jgi:hypothetical protein
MYNRKKEIIKSCIYTFFILAIAVVSTYYIYYKFQDDRSVDATSESLDVTYHESTGDRVGIYKVTPVTDSVGLSSKSYNISIKNNLTESVPYSIKLVDDLEKIVDDNCEDNLIPKSEIRVSAKVKKKDNVIYTLDEIKDGVLLDSEIEALEEINISIRLWIKHDSNLPSGARMHYHGILQVAEGNDIIDLRRVGD